MVNRSNPLAPFKKPSQQQQQQIKKEVQKKLLQQVYTPPSKAIKQRVSRGFTTSGSGQPRAAPRQAAPAPVPKQEVIVQTIETTKAPTAAIKIQQPDSVPIERRFGTVVQQDNFFQLQRTTEFDVPLGPVKQRVRVTETSQVGEQPFKESTIRTAFRRLAAPPEEPIKRIEEAPERFVRGAVLAPAASIPLTVIEATSFVVKQRKENIPAPAIAVSLGSKAIETGIKSVTELPKLAVERPVFTAGIVGSVLVGGIRTRAAPKIITKEIGVIKPRTSTFSQILTKGNIKAGRQQFIFKSGTFVSQKEGKGIALGLAELTKRKSPIQRFLFRKEFGEPKKVLVGAKIAQIEPAFGFKRSVAIGKVIPEKGKPIKFGSLSASRERFGFQTSGQVTEAPSVGQKSLGLSVLKRISSQDEGIRVKAPSISEASSISESAAASAVSKALAKTVERKTPIITPRLPKTSPLRIRVEKLDSSIRPNIIQKKYSVVQSSNITQRELNAQDVKQGTQIRSSLDSSLGQRAKQEITSRQLSKQLQRTVQVQRQRTKSASDTQLARELSVRSVGVSRIFFPFPFPFSFRLPKERRRRQPRLPGRLVGRIFTKPFAPPERLLGSDIDLGGFDMPKKKMKRKTSKRRKKR